MSNVNEMGLRLANEDILHDAAILDDVGGTLEVVVATR